MSTKLMSNWFECKITYDKVCEDGMNKKVTGPYLVDALSFTEAESRIIEEVTSFTSGKFTVKDIKRARYNEIVQCDEEEADKWFSCKLEFITLNVTNRQEKKTKVDYLIQASDLRDAMKKMDDYMKDSMMDYNAVCIKETAIMDVFPYVP